MVLQIPQHAHCMVCGKAIQVEEKTCSETCTKGMEDHNRKRKYMMYFMYALIGFTVVLLFLGAGRTA